MILEDGDVDGSGAAIVASMDVEGCDGVDNCDEGSSTNCTGVTISCAELEHISSSDCSGNGLATSCLLCSAVDLLSTCRSCNDSFCEKHAACHGWIGTCVDESFNVSVSKSLNQLVVKETSKFYFSFVNLF